MNEEQFPHPALRRAAAILPAKARQRYLQEWAADWLAADSETERQDVLKGSITMATRVRARDIGSSLFGAHGVVAALAGWLLLGLLVVLAMLLGGPVGALSVFAVVAALGGVAMGGLPTRGSHWSIVLGLTLGVACIAYTFAAISAGVDAADAGREPPWWAGQVALAGAGVLAGAALFIGGAVVNHRRSILR